MNSELVNVNIENGIADIQFNRAGKHNSLTTEMFVAIAAAGAEVHENPTVRVAVVSGNGPSFCAGLDFSLMRALLARDGEQQNIVETLMARDGGPDNLAQRVAYCWKTAAVPVIAAIQGVAFGGGFQIAMGCDIRIAHPAARFSIMEMRYGLIPDMSITQTLPAFVARDVALELALSAREFDAAEALQRGLITQIADQPLLAARDLASLIAARSPHAVRACKRLFNEAWRSDAASGLALEASLQRSLIGSRNQREAVSASLEKRTPDFVDAVSS